MHRGKYCLVVGGTQGIGFAIVQTLLREEAELVMVCSRKQSNVNAVTKSNQERIRGVACNVSNDLDLEKLAVFVQSNIPRGKNLDVLVSNVGVDPLSGKALDASDNLFDKIFKTNVKATWMIMKLLRPLMTAGSSILLVSSTGGFQPSFPSGLYGVSKAALIGLGRALATELGPDGIRLNVICPGLVKTRMSEQFWKGPYRVQAENALFLRRLGEPEDIADVASFLLSSGARWITGEAIVVSGGTHTRL